MSLLSCSQEARGYRRGACQTCDVWPSNYKLGMWIWLFHRITGVIILLYGIAHLAVISMSLARDGGQAFNRLMALFEKPAVLALEMALLAVILFHTANGLRILVMDMAMGVRVQKALFWSFIGVGAVFQALAVYALLPYIQGSPLS
ncbi:MAG: succinate dehydrogenase, cytochrome b556 subunit [Chloroflexi bacterium]|nr:succinate dehydrogenase, cytochrome b556 subunit [Chloroflexota bacterium]